MHKPGIYIITCISNGKHYIGSSCRSIRDRIILHISRLRNGKHHSILLQRAFNKYGEEDFTFKVLELCTPDKCIEREQYWLDLVQSYNPKYGMNICEYAYSTKGCKFTNRKKRGPEHPFAGLNKSNAMKGVPKSRAHAMAVGKATKKPIIQLSLIGETIKEWDSTRDVELVLGFGRSNINSCLKGKRPTANGFKWRYK